MSPTFEFPDPEEYAPFYDGYVQRAKKGNVLETLARQINEVQNIFGKLSEEQALFRPAPEEWSIKQVLGHINDAERIFFYRALCIARGEIQSLPSFDQDQYVRGADFDSYRLGGLIHEFTLARQVNLLSIRHISAEAGLRRGLVNEHPASARALIHIMVGHVYHHLESIEAVYLPALQNL